MSNRIARARRKAAREEFEVIRADVATEATRKLVNKYRGRAIVMAYVVAVEALALAFVAWAWMVKP